MYPDWKIAPPTITDLPVLGFKYGLAVTQQEDQDLDLDNIQDETKRESILGEAVDADDEWHRQEDDRNSEQGTDSESHNSNWGDDDSDDGAGTQKQQHMATKSTELAEYL